MSEYKYQSPIEMVQDEMEMKVEGEVMKAVQNVGINVNKDELLKALAYDRDQYNKGYNDGKPKKGRWKLEFLVSTNGDPYAVYRCNLCEWAEPTLLRRNYCPNCGSRMFERRTDERDNE